jgi:hypothetical protein
MDVYRILGNDDRGTYPGEGSVFLKLNEKFCKILIQFSESKLSIMKTIAVNF